MLYQVCPNCNEALDWKDARPGSNSWGCRHCGSRHPLLETALTVDQLQYKAKVTSAKGVHIRQQSPLVITVTSKAKSNGWLFLIIGLFLVWFTRTTAKAVQEKATVPVDASFYLFMGVLALIGLALLYLGAKRLFFSQQLKLNTNELVVEDLLLGFISFRKTVLPHADIKQLFVKGEEDASLEDTSDNTQTHISYQLIARRHNGTDVSLVAGLKKYQAAFLLESQIEKALGITDERVPEELIPWPDLLYQG